MVHDLALDVVRRSAPDLDDALVALFVGEQAALELLFNRADFLFGSFQNRRLLRRHDNVGHGHGDSADGGILVAHRLDVVQHAGSLRHAVLAETHIDDLTQLLLANQERNFQIKLMLGICTVYIAQILRNVFVKDQTANGTINNLRNPLITNISGNPYFNLCVNGNIAFIVSHEGFVDIPENLAFALFAILFHGQVIRTQNHILCRNSNRTTVRRLQQVVRSQHQESCFCLCFCGQRQMDCHLVAVEVCVKCRAYQRVQLQSTTFYQYRFKCLNTQTVQRRSTVQQNRMSLDDIFQCIPNFRRSPVYHLSGTLNICNDLGIYQPLQNERLEQFQCHFLRQTALIHPQFRTNDDNRTTGVVNTLTEQVLTESTLLALQHIRQGFQCTVIRARNRSAVSAVVNQSIDCFLQHPLFVPDDDVRCIQFQHPLQPVVPVDDTAVQIIQVGGCVPSAVQHNHRTNVRRNNRNNVQNHPFRTVAGLPEGFHDFQPLQQLQPLLTGIQSNQFFF